MVDKYEDAAIISGLGISRIKRRSGRSLLEHTGEAAMEAIADAGLTIGDIDGLSTIGDISADSVQDALGLQISWAGGMGSGAQLSAFMHACMAVATGAARHVLVYRTVSMRGGELTTGGIYRRWAEWMLPFGAYTAAHWLGMHCHRHMHLYGTTKEQLGWVAITAREHAANNERAAYRDPITMEDYLSSRTITEPFGLLDCDVPVDGSVAVVVSAADYAGDCPHHPVRVEAVGHAVQGRPSWDQRPDYPRMVAHDAAAQMWSRTSLKPSDVDTAQLYDGFTFLALNWLEALGFCGEGEAGPFVEGGDRIRIGGELPLNTYGGQLSAGRMHGYWVLHEAALQLRGQAGARQVADAEVAAVAAGGGPLGGTVLLTR